MSRFCCQSPVHRVSLLQLWLPTPPPHRLNPRLGLRLSEDRRDLGTVATGTAKNVTCTHDSYTYTDRREWKIATLNPDPAELGDQVSYAWFANGLPIAPAPARPSTTPRPTTARGWAVPPASS